MKSDLKNIKNISLSTLSFLSRERSQKFFGIVVTLCAIAFFGLFAIKPTISTILKLQKEVSDNQFVLDQLEVKIKNLSELRKRYSALQGDLPTITAAITAQPDVHLLFAQIQSIAKSSNVSINSLQNLEVEVIKNEKSTSKNYYSYSFTIKGKGSLDDIYRFVQVLTNMERVVNIDLFSLNLTSDQNNASLEYNIQGTAFFKDNS